MTKINRKAGFWVRSLALIIDLLVFCFLGIITSLMCIEKRQEDYEKLSLNLYLVREDWTYFIWLLFLILLITIFFIAIPFLTKGKTFGMFVIGLETKFNNNFKQSFLKRIELGPFLWIFLIILFLCFVWPSTINKMVKFLYIKNNFTESNSEIEAFLVSNKWSVRETIFYTIPTSISPILVMLNLFLLISIGFKKNKIGLVDRFSDSYVVYVNKFDKVENNVIETVKPILNIEYKIEWRN